jgi:hypothetical protein
MSKISKSDLKDILSKLTSELDNTNSTGLLRNFLIKKFIIPPNTRISTLQNAIDKCKIIKLQNVKKYNVKDFKSLKPPPVSIKQSNQESYTKKTVAIEIFRADKKNKKWYKCVVASNSIAWNFMNLINQEKVFMIISSFAVETSTELPTDTSDIKEAKQYVLERIKNDQNNKLSYELINNQLLLNAIFDELIKDDPIVAKLLRSGESGNIMYSFTLNPNLSGSNLTCFENVPVQNSLNHAYIASDRLKYDFNLNAHNLNNMIIRKEVLKPNSCGPQAIVDAYKKSFEAYKSKFQNSKFPTVLDYNYVAKVIQKSWDGIGPFISTPKELADFLQQHNLGLIIYNNKNDILYERMPEKLTTQIFPKILQLIYHDQHVTLCTRRVKANNKEENYVYTKLVQEYPTSTINRTSYAMFEEPNEIPHIIKKFLKEDIFKVRLVYNGGIMNNLITILRSSGITPHVIAQNGLDFSTIVLRHLYCNGKEFDVSISCPCLVHGEMGLTFRNKKEFEIYTDYECQIDKVLLSRRNVSYIDEDTLNILETCSPRILTGKIKDFDVSILHEISALDWSKFYATALSEIPYIPIISPFFKFECFDGTIKKSYLYLVNINVSRNPCYPIGQTIMFYEELLTIEVIDIDIQFQMRIFQSSSKGITSLIQQLFESSLNPIFKKALVNKAIGKCGKKSIRCRETSISSTENDAMRLALLHNGYVVKMLDSDNWVTSWLSGEKKLHEFLTPIRYLILTIARQKMSKLYTDVKKDFSVIGFRTDSIYIISKKKDLYYWLTKKGYQIGDNIGCIKVVKNALPPSYPISKTLSEHITISPITNASILIIEHDKAQDVLDVPNKTIALCRAGRGKTHTIISLAKKKHKSVLVCTPWNSQAKAIAKDHDVDTCTFYNLLGIDSEDKFRKPPLNIKKYNAIIFDEILLLSHRHLVYLEKYITKHSYIFYYATGDPCQLEAIDDIIGVKSRLNAVKIIFPNILKIQKSARVAESDLLLQLEEDLLEKRINVKDVAEKYFKIVSLEQAFKIGVRQGVTYFNNTADLLNCEFHKQIPHTRISNSRSLNGITYYQGDKLICRETFWLNSKKRICTNFEFTIKRMNNKQFILVDFESALEEEFQVPYDRISKYFRLPYFSTVHSAQGKTVNGLLLIANWQNNIVNSHWFYTAVTRTRSLKNVLLLNIDIGGYHDIKAEAKDMVENYMVQDIVAKRLIDKDEYITIDWIISQYQKVSGVCRECTSFMTFEKNNINKVTVNRLNNSLCHSIYNSELLCLTCNYAT